MIPQIFNSSIGKKAVTAVSGLILVLFVIGHLIGNLQIFLGQQAINMYAVHLRELGPVLWLARIVLIAALIIHIIFSIRCARENRAARPVKYVAKNTVQASIASVTMVISGITLLAYIIYHLLHFTFHVTNPGISHGTDPMGHPDVYAMMVLSFQNIYISAAYIIGLIPLCFHLSHGLSSWAQSLGLNNEKLLPLLRRGGQILSLLIYIGYVSIPAAVLLNVIKMPGQAS